MNLNVNHFFNTTTNFKISISAIQLKTPFALKLKSSFSGYRWRVKTGSSSSDTSAETPLSSSIIWYPADIATNQVFLWMLGCFSCSWSRLLPRFEDHCWGDSVFLISHRSRRCDASFEEFGVHETGCVQLETLKQCCKDAQTEEDISLWEPSHLCLKKMSHKFVILIYAELPKEIIHFGIGFDGIDGLYDEMQGIILDSAKFLGRQMSLIEYTMNLEQACYSRLMTRQETLLVSDHGIRVCQHVF